MDYEDDFATEEIVDLKVENRIFKYKPTNAGQELDWLPLYTRVEEGKQVIDNAELNKLKMLNVVGVPYSDELIRKILKIDNETIGWATLSDNQKWELFKKLKGSMFDKIGTAIINYDCGTKKKNLIYKIAVSDSQTGFILENTEEALLFYKWQFWKKGISPNEFRRLRVRDVKDVVEIENAINEKGFREAEVQNLVNNVKSRW